MAPRPKESPSPHSGAPGLALILSVVLLASQARATGHDCPRVLAEQLRGHAAACRLLREGRLSSAEGNVEVVYRLYRWVSTRQGPPSPLYDTPPYNQAAVTLSLAGTSANEAFWGAHHWLGMGWFEAPTIVRNDHYGELLAVPGRLTGTGSLVADHLLMPTSTGVWRAVEADQLDQETGRGWAVQLKAYLPEGFHIAKGILVDYTMLTGETPVWRSEDANCCPSGGHLSFKLELQGPALSLAIAWAHYTPPID